MQIWKAVICIVCALSIGLSSSSQSTQTKKKIMILGTYHFISNNDILKTEKEDVLSEKRQKEIKELTDLLLQFKPDKIFIEWRPGRPQKYADSLYTAFLKGEYELGRNEIFQIGFRMASQLHHKKLYCVDAPGLFLMDTLFHISKKYGQFDQLIRFQDSIKAEYFRDNSLMKKKTIREALYQMNTKAGVNLGLISNHVFKGAELGEVGEYAGAEFVGEWYKRNIRMYSNMIRSVEAGENRFFFIVGAAHKPIIQHFFAENPEWEIVDVNDYLKQ